MGLKPISIPWRQYAIPLAVLVAGLLFTAAAAMTTRHFVLLRDKEHFERLQGQTLRAIDRRFETYTALLRGLASTVATRPDLDEAGFAAFAAHAGDPDAYPGLRSVSFVRALGPEATRRAAVLARMPPGVRLWPTADGASAVQFVHPLTEASRQLLGFDMLSEPVRRQAMLAARASNLPRASGRVTPLRQGRGAVRGVLLFLPVTGSAAAPGLAAPFLGWVYAGFRTKALFDATFAGTGLLNQIGVRVYDQTGAGDRLLYASPGVDGENGPTSYANYDVAGRDWLIRFTAGPRFERIPVSTTILPIALAGLAITLSLTFATWLQAHGLQRALSAEAAARAARDRSAVLMDEVNHRTANSLQLVAALVSMQADQVKEPAARDALVETRARIMAVSRVHQRLYASGDVTTVALGPYLESLVAELGHSSHGGGVRLTLITDEVGVPTDRAVSIGIVVAELVTNALKYAYPAGAGEIRIRLERSPGVLALKVEDDGVGAPEGGSKGSTGLGMRIVRAMASNLGGVIAVDGAPPGHRVALTFPA